MVNETIAGAFAAYWKNLMAENPELAAYPKSYQTQLRNAFENGFKAGQTERAIEAEVHKEIDRENRVN